MNTEMTRKYANEVAEELKDLAPDMEYIIRNVHKNNMVLTCIVARKPESSVAPAIYVEGFIEEKLPANLAAKKALDYIVKAYATEPEQRLRLDAFNDYGKMKDKLDILVTGDSDYAAQHAFIDCGAGIYAIPIAHIGNDGFVKIEERHLKEWGIDKETLFADAKKNLLNNGLSIKKLDDIDEVEAIYGPVDLPMRVVSNKERFYGAAVMLLPEFNRKCLEMFPDGYYIIPSSIHELIIMPKDYLPVDQLKKMVTEVNADVVNPSDKLSDNVLAIENGKLIVVEDEECA